MDVGGWLSAVDVGKSVEPGQVADGEGLAGLPGHRWIAGQRRHGAAYVGDRFHLSLLALRQPGHPLDGHPARRHPNDRQVGVPGLFGQRSHQPADGVLGHVVEDVPQVAAAPRERGQYRQAIPGFLEQRHPEQAGGEMGAQPGGEHAVPAVHRLLPERLGEPLIVLGVGQVATPGIGH